MSEYCMWTQPFDQCKKMCISMGLIWERCEVKDAIEWWQLEYPPNWLLNINSDINIWLNFTKVCSVHKVILAHWVLFINKEAMSLFSPRFTDNNLYVNICLLHEWLKKTKIITKAYRIVNSTYTVNPLTPEVIPPPWGITACCPWRSTHR